MELVIPEGARVHITIENTPMLAPPDEIAPTRPPTRPSLKLLKGGLALVLLFGAFEAGRQVAARPDATGPTRAAFAMPGQAPAPVPEQHAFPDRPLREALAPGAPAQEIPPEFRQQLAQPPSVIPPPGGTAGKNPFGLEN